MLNRLIMLGGALLWATTGFAEQYDFRNTYASAGIGYEAKMPDEDKYGGTKLLIEGRYYLSIEQQEVSEHRRCCMLPSTPTKFRGLLEGAARFGFDGTGLEYLRLGITPWATMWEPGLEADKDWQAKRDYLEIGTTRYIKDEPQEVKYYLEVALGRVGRMVEYQRSQDSVNKFIVGVQASTGWAWAESENKLYSRVSNPFAGLYFDLTWEHQRWGSIYVLGRFVNGFSFSNPSRGHPTVREGGVRSGYRKEFRNNLLLDVYSAKRSFYFDEGDLPGLYTWTRTYAAELRYSF